jgi:hypothetical protein
MLFIELLQEEVLQIFQTKYFNSIQGFSTIKYGPRPRHPTSSATPHPTHALPCLVLHPLVLTDIHHPFRSARQKKKTG